MEAEKKLGTKFLIASLIYFGINITMGAVMTIGPIYKFIILSSLFGRAHAHIGLIGWLSLSIIGFIYYLILGNSGKQIYSEMLGDTGFWLLNIGIFAEAITLLIGGCDQAYSFMIGELDAHVTSLQYNMLTIIFAFVMLIGAYMTVYNIYKTIRS